MRKILVTGAAGYIGSVLVRQLLDNGYVVRGMDNLNFGGESLLSIYNHPHFEFFNGDIRKLDDIKTSLDVFPIEFLNFKLIHSNVFGEDILNDIEIDRMDLRHQCERELKTKLIQLRQGYISSQGNRKTLTEGFVSSIAGYLPLFRGIIVLFGKEPTVRQNEVITALAEAVNIKTDVFTKVLREKHDKTKLSTEELNTIFEDYYAATEQIGKVVDEIQ